MERFADHRFEFEMDVVKARETDDGKWIVSAIATDNGADVINDVVTERCMERMLRKVKTTGVPLLNSHKDSFEFGKAVDGRILKGHNGPQSVALELDFMLDKKYPQAQDLWELTTGGTCDKQLSIGGKPNRSNPRALFKVGDKRYLDDLDLEHVTTTRAHRAMNDRTGGFRSAIMKSLDIPDEVWKELELPEGEVEKFLPGLIMMGGGPREETDDEDAAPLRQRTLKELPTFVEMRRKGYNAYLMNVTVEGLADKLPGEKIELPAVTDADEIERLRDYMKEAGVPNTEKLGQNGKLPVFGTFIGAEDTSLPNVGLDPTGKYAAVYVTALPSQMAGKGDREFDDNGKLIGGPFPFVAKGRPLPGSSAYSNIWPVPSVMELQILQPKAVSELERRMSVEKALDVEKQAVDEVWYPGDPNLVVLGIRKLKFRTASAEDHSHELHLEIDNQGDVIRGKTSEDMNHSHRVEPGERRTTEWPYPRWNRGNREESVAGAHYHTFDLEGELAKLNEEILIMPNEVTRKDPGALLFASLPDGSVETFQKNPEEAKLGDVKQTYGLLLESKDGTSRLKQLGPVNRLTAMTTAQGIVAGGGVKRVVVGRGYGKIGNRLLYTALAEYNPAEKSDINPDLLDDLDKTVVGYRAYPVSQSTTWSFTPAEGTAIINENGGEDSAQAWGMYREAHAYFDPAMAREGEAGPPRVRAAYKLPHHKLENGQMRTFRRGVIAAIAAVNGARGGTQLPAGERQGVYNHLARHAREQFEMTPPPLRKEAAKELKVGELDTEYLAWFKEFFKQQGEDMAWLDEYLKEEIKLEKEQLKGADAATEEPKASPAPETPPAEEPAAKTEEHKEETPEKTAEEKATVGIMAKIAHALGFKAPDPKMEKVERGATLLQTASDVLEQMEEGADISMLKESVVKLAAKVGLKIEEEAPEEPSQPAVDGDKIAEKAAKLVLEQLAPLLKKEEAEEPKGKDEAKKEEEAPETPPETDEGKKTDDEEDAPPADEQDGEVKKSLEELVGLVKGIGTRLEAVENVSGIKKSKDGQEGPGSETKRRGIWTGVIPSVGVARMKRQAEIETTAKTEPPPSE